MGNIGHELAVRARAFGMEVIAVSARHLTEGAEAGRARFREAIGRCHYVSLHLPLTVETRGLFDRTVLSWFRDGAYLINTARAEVLDDEAAADALRSGKLAGLATDVWITDPPDGSPLLEAPNTLVTPHLGASTRENMTRIGDVVEEILKAHVVGHHS
jgi:phosphoglycerate dehydrogenase-like enzyme